MRLVMMFGVAAGMAAALVIVSSNIGDGSRALLYSGLDLTEAGQIAERLDQAGVPHELRAGGTAIYVAPDQVLSARLMLSSEGLPGQASLCNELFDRGDGTG